MAYSSAIGTRVVLNMKGSDMNEIDGEVKLAGMAEAVAQPRTRFQRGSELKPLTTEELKAGGWWLDEVDSHSLQELFREYGVNITGVSKSWFSAGEDAACVISSSDYGRDLSGLKQIFRVGNEFY